MNKVLENFKRITLKGKTQANFKKHILLKLIDNMLKEERKQFYQQIFTQIQRQINKTEQDQFTYIWGGKEKEDVEWIKIKKDILIDIEAELEDYAKKNKLL